MPDQPTHEHVTHAPYNREPYVRATLDDGSVVDFQQEQGNLPDNV